MKLNTSADLDLKILSVDYVFIYIDRYTHTQDRFVEYSERFNIKV